MPVLDQLAQAYAAQGLVVIAINIGESETRYKDFVDAREYAHLRWARDATLETVRAYKVRGIPVSYVLDGDGVIRFAHIGYTSSLDDKLAREIESLLQ